MKKSVQILIGLIVGMTVFVLYGEFGEKFRGGKDVARETKIDLDLSSYETAVFSGGCFWCTESDFEKTDGVVEAISGYTGGHTENPTYAESNTGTTGHREAVQVYYDPEMVTYEQLLDVYWRHHDPADAGGSFGDRGEQYTSALYYKDEEQKVIIEKSISETESQGVLKGSIVTVLKPEVEFYVAEDYHQDYYLKNPSRYSFYRGGSGRDRYIEKTWGDTLKKAQMHAGGGKAKKDIQKI